MGGRVYLIDDDAGVQRGVAALLKAAGYRVDTFSSAEIFLAALPELERGGAAILVDVCMPGMQGTQLQAYLVAQEIAIPTVIMTAHGDIHMAVSAMRKGAVDFLEKPFTGDELTAALDRAFEMLSAEPVGERTAGELRERFESLTAREREVLCEMLNGHSNKLIARELKLSPRTVEVHRRNIMAKTNASSFAELIRMAVECGFCD